MKPPRAFRIGLMIGIPALATITFSPLAASPITWNNSTADGLWSTAANWDTNAEPTSADDMTFPLGLAGIITTTTTENALSLTFNDAYTLSGGTLALASGNSISVADGVTATINNALNITGGLSKTGTGTLILTALNTNPGGTVISAGKLRVSGNASALGASAVVTTVNDGATLEVAGGYSLDRPITLMNGGTVAGLGTATNNGKITIDAAATSVTLATDQAGDVFTVGNAANELTGGSLVAGTTVIGIAGPGTVRLGASNDFDGSWSIPSGRLELGAAAALGDQASSSVTLAGGTLSARIASATTFTGPAGNLIVTADSGLLSDRSSVSAGLTHTLGTLSIGTHTLTVAPGASANSGTAGITLGNVTLTGNPTFAVNDAGSANGKLTTGSILGGAARTIAKSGAGDLTVTGGATDLPAGSTFTATGGGTIEMLFPNLGATTPVAITAVQNPFGEASVSVTDGALRLLADGSGTSAAQTYQLPTTITLGGSVTLDPDRRSGSNTNKTFELPGLTLAADTVLGMSGNNTHGVRLTGPLALSGDATLQGVPLSGQDGLLTLNGGISGAAGDSLTIAGGTSLMNLTINAASTYGGGTEMSGSNVTLNAANAFGTGATSLSGGSLIVNTDGALNGTVSITGGTLRVNDTDALAANPVHLAGGTLDFRNNTAATITTGTLTVSGTSSLSVGNNGSGSSQAFGFPALNVSGNTTLTVTPLNNFVPNLSAIMLAGDLTLSNSDDTRIQTVGEDAMPRRFIKTGTGLLRMEAAGTHSGGTEVLAGTLSVEHASALGSGTLTLGDAAGTATATAQFSTGLAIANDIVVRSGSSGTATLDSPSGGVTWNGDLALQKSVTLDNGSSTVSSSFTGTISGTGSITKTSAGELVLGNASNSFLGAIAISDGTLTVSSDGALGNPANGVSLAGDAILKIDAAFATSRTITFNGTTNSVSVGGANEFTVNSPIAGAGAFLKSGTGTLVIAPGVDSSGRGGASSGITGGILRVQGVKNLSDAGPVTLNGTAGTIEFLADANTNFAHPVTADGTGTIHVDRAAGGSATNGRHTLGTLGMASGSLTVTGANGYGLSLGATTISSSNSIVNNAPGTLVLASFTGNPGSSSLTQTFGGSGDIDITGALAEGAGTGNYAITKTGAGTLRFGTSVAEFGRLLTVNDGTLDLNGLTHTVTGLVTLGGAASALGAEIDTGAAGSLVLGAGLTFGSTGSPAGARVTGNLDLGAITQPFTVNDSGGATVDLTLDGPITGSPGSAITKSGTGTLRMSGAGNTLPGLVTVTAGLLELAKSSGNAIGTGGLSITGGTTRLTAAGQIDDSAAVSLNSANEVFLDLNGFSETTGALSLTQTDANDYSALKTGAAGTLVLNGNLTLNNNTNSSVADGREVLITGSGTETVPAFDGTLDLGGATRTIHVATTTVGTNEPKANATIETQIINGGILKTGPRTLYLTNPNNTFAGGLQIAEGFVRPGSGTSLGLGPVTFTNAPGTAAGLDFSSLTGTVANTIVTGTGDFTFTYAGAAPNVLTLSGGFDLEQDLTVDVVNGSVQNGTPTDVLRAVVDVTGPIDDAAGTFGLTKVGDGMLKLAAGNSYGGPTVVERGILSLAADSSLGDTSAPLTLDGGCLAPSVDFTLTRDLAIGANGGSLRADSLRTMTITGMLDWGSATTGTDGGGRIVLSGATTGSGNLIIGESIAFATGTVGQQLTWGAKVSLQGSAALPTGNLDFGGFGVLELGTGDFTRPLGTGPGEVQMSTNVGGGWAAVGADRVVNLGGAGAPLTWGQASPPFLYQDGPGTGDFGQLVLGSFTATHTVEFQNDLVFPAGASFSVIRGVSCLDGAAAVDARITGDAIQSDPSKRGSLTFTGDGTLEMTGDLLGDFGVTQDGEGTTTLSGNNTGLTNEISVFEGTLVFANDASLGSPFEIVVFPGNFHSELDASALSGPLTLPNFGTIAVDGLLTGDVLVNGSLYGSGSITGDVTVPAGSTVYPTFDATLTIGGDFTLQPGASAEFEVYGPTSGYQSSALAVTGAVNLSGSFYAFTDSSLQLGETQFLILNDGIDPINGTFSGLPEAWGFSLGNGFALQFSYVANGDGGAVGNDLSVTLVVDTFSADLALTAEAPLVVDLGASFSIVYTISNLGPNNSPGSSLEIDLPPAATFNGSTPAGTLGSGVLIIPIGAIPNGGDTTVTLNFTAPGATAGLFVSPWIYGASGNGNLNNDHAPTVTAVLPGGCPALTVFTTDPVNQEITLGINAVQDVRYSLQYSFDLIDWFDLYEFIGQDEPVEFTEPMDETREFFRFAILPYNGGGGGGGGGAN